MRRNLFHWTVFGLLLFAVTLAGAEVVASFLVPSWPARMLRPVPTGSTSQATGHLFDVTYNGWGMRDRERSVARPADVRFRAVLVGDSFLEGAFQPETLAGHLERGWKRAGVNDAEAVNLGVTATGPNQYFHRIDRVALDLAPDAIVVFVYAGNDYIYQRRGGFQLPAVVDELPLPSLLGSVAPRFTWFLVERLGLSEIGRSNSPIPNELETLQAIVEGPAGQRTARIAEHVRRHYHPELDEPKIREIFERGGGAFWSAFERQPPDREYLLGWLTRSIVEWETGSWTLPRDAAEAERTLDTRPVEATLTWLEGAAALVRSRGVKFQVVLIPPGTGDAEYVRYWRHWPRYFSYNQVVDARHRRMAGLLRERGIPFIDLSEDLGGAAGTYRLIDGHWTLRGHELVAARVGRELARLRGEPGPR